MSGVSSEVMNRSRRARTMLVGVALVAGACGNAEVAETTAATESSSTSVVSEASTTSFEASADAVTQEAPTTSAAVEEPTPDLVNLVGGGQLDLNSIEGTDTVLWFWAPW